MKHYYIYVEVATEYDNPPKFRVIEAYDFDCLLDEENNPTIEHFTDFDASSPEEAHATAVDTWRDIYLNSY